jgi:hypothetical protein
LSEYWCLFICAFVCPLGITLGMYITTHFWDDLPI